MIAMQEMMKQSVDVKKLPMATALAAGGGAVMNTLIYFVAQALGVSFEISMWMWPDDFTLEIPFFMPAFATAMSAVAAVGLLWVLNFFTDRPYTIFLIIAGVFLLMSLTGPLFLSAPFSTRLALSLMHIAAAAVIVGAVLRHTQA